MGVTPVCRSQVSERETETGAPSRSVRPAEVLVEHLRLLGLALNVVPNSATVIPATSSLWSLVHHLQVPLVPLFLPSVTVYSSLEDWPEAINLFAVPQSLAGRVTWWPNSLASSLQELMAGASIWPLTPVKPVLTRPSLAATVAVRVHAASLLP
ncbi:hypothetical protein BC826DRAFT_970865 [Russula brevipes]|nr:hypothetical protein BC826DRAFT_970865 [Russula brevipes]